MAFIDQILLNKGFCGPKRFKKGKHTNTQSQLQLTASLSTESACQELGGERGRDRKLITKENDIL